MNDVFYYNADEAKFNIIIEDLLLINESCREIHFVQLYSICQWHVNIITLFKGQHIYVRRVGTDVFAFVLLYNGTRINSESDGIICHLLKKSGMNNGLIISEVAFIFRLFSVISRPYEEITNYVNLLQFVKRKWIVHLIHSLLYSQHSKCLFPIVHFNRFLVHKPLRSFIVYLVIFNIWITIFILNDFERAMDGYSKF